MLQFDVCCKAIDQNFDCGCDRCAILRLDSLAMVMNVRLAAAGSCSFPTVQKRCQLRVASENEQEVASENTLF